MSAESFFDESKEQSQVKSAIVSKYFWAWSRVMLATIERYKKVDRIAYIDLFAGPGRYKDGSKSTPILILEQVVDHPKMRDTLLTWFNDKDENNTRSLETAIKKIPGIENLKYPPRIDSKEVGDEIVKLFREMRLIPTLFFVDPWGYKGLSLQLINAVIKDWGCDCIFFFNYNRINMGLNNPIVKEHMEALFGVEQAAELCARVVDLSPYQRELAIVEAISKALNPASRRFVLPFCFKNANGSRTSHHLIFVSKHFRGYEIMKEIMASESSNTEQGVATFIYSPADKNNPLLFELSRPLDDLEALLVASFAGETVTMEAIYTRHSVGTPYTASNYKRALLNLEQAGKIVTNPAKRKSGTFADSVHVTFPPR